MNNDNLEIDGIIYSPIVHMNYQMRDDIIPILIINSKIGDLYVFGHYVNVHYYNIKSITYSSVVLKNKTLSIYRSISEIRISKLMTIYG